MYACMYSQYMRMLFLLPFSDFCPVYACIDMHVCLYSYYVHTSNIHTQVYIHAYIQIHTCTHPHILKKNKHAYHEVLASKFVVVSKVIHALCRLQLECVEVLSHPLLFQCV
jgi:hypothetical protein